MAEVVKTGLLAGEPLWELPDDELVRRCAAFKAAICLRDPHDDAERKLLNLGHTFAHALEAAAGYEGITHGQAVALGLLAALRLSGRDDRATVEEILARSRCGSTGSGPGRRCGATRRPSAASCGSSCSVTAAPMGRRGARGGRAARARRTDRRIAVTPVRIIVLNGVNLNVLGRRDPAVYGALAVASSRAASTTGRASSSSRCSAARRTARASSSSGATTRYDNTDGMVVNPGAWTHYAWSIHDALEPLPCPIVEVHLSNVDEREEWRRISVISRPRRDTLRRARAPTATGWPSNI